MDAQRWAEVSRLFLAMHDVPSTEWGAALEEACDDPSIRDEVRSMLEAEARPEPLAFERLVAGGTGDEQRSNRSARSQYRRRDGERVGPYVLRELVGQGGMSDVYRAERVGGDFEQTVAIKVLAVGLRGPEAARRFRGEGRILARLNHPNIARLLDGGATEDGVPYLVMEYVDGLPITEYCDRRMLSLAERIRIFRRVCAAVRFAHANLVVHRDLKPTNVLVTNDGEVRLLDFGIAKLVQDGAHGGATTRAGERAMTPEYASPEQINGDVVTTATDVYGLGLILYELLTGRHPFRSPTARGPAFHNSVLESNPPSLVDAAQTPEDPATESPAEWSRRVAIARRADTNSLGRSLTGDLETIVRKALHRSPERRYQSPIDLSDDLGRYLSLLPIRARPDSVSYRTTRFVQRNRVALSVVGILSTAALALGVSTVMQTRAVAAERDRAEREASKARLVQEFMVGMFASADPIAGRDTLRVGQLLEEGAERVTQELSDQPELQGAMLVAIGEAFRGLGRNERSRELISEATRTLERHLGPKDPETLRARRLLAVSLTIDLKYAEAADAYETYLQHASTALDSLDLEVLDAQESMSDVLHQLGQIQRSDSLFDVWVSRVSNAQFPDTADVGEFYVNQGRRYWVRRDYESAERLITRGIRAERAVHGDFHPAVATSLNALIPVLWDQRRYEEAEATALESIRIFRTHYPQGHRLLGSALIMLGEVRVRSGADEGVEALYDEALDIYLRLEGPDYPGIGEVHRRFGHLARSRGEPTQAVAHYQKAVDLYRGVFGADGLMTVEHRQHVAVALMEAGRFEESEEILQRACATLEAQRGAENQFTQECLWRSVDLYEAWGRSADAEQVRGRTTIPDRRSS